MAGQTIEIIVKFFHIFAVVALGIGETKKALFKNGVLAIPQSHAHTQIQFVIGKSAKAVFAPAIAT